MKKIGLYAVLLFIAFGIKAQVNPYGSLGIETKVLTLSDGKYEEFFDLDSIQQIGTILYNINTGKVVGEVVENEKYYIPKFSASRFISVDPIAEKYLWISPYAYALNNPIRFIAPDGRAPENSIMMIRNKIKFIIVILIVMFGCKNDIVKTGVLMSSYNIEQSKSLGVFKCEYIPSKKHIDIGNKEFDLEEVWVEHYWSYLNQKREIEKDKDCQGLIKLNIDDNLSSIEISYSKNAQKSICVRGNKLCFDSLNNQDTIEITFHGEKEESITLVRKQ